MKNFNLQRLKNYLDTFLRPYCKKAFIKKIKSGAFVLDVGCGNESDKIFRQLSPESYYIGIDIQSPPRNYLGNEYFLSTPENFNESVLKALTKVDVIISSHNLEHCDNYKELVSIFTASTKAEKLFLSFPSSASLTLPKSKYGTLNFYQDSTHNELPDVVFILNALEKNGWKVDFCGNPYRPVLPSLIGILWMPIFKLTGIESPLYGTYSFFGFETIIWASKC